MNDDNNENNNIPNVYSRYVTCRHVIIGHIDTGIVIHTTIYKSLRNSLLQYILRSENLYLIYLHVNK